jgi:hypothetical protein
MIDIPNCDLILPDRPFHDPAYGRPGMHLEYAARPMTQPSSMNQDHLLRTAPPYSSWKSAVA